jgi:hypothetical protein
MQAKFYILIHTRNNQPIGVSGLILLREKSRVTWRYLLHSDIMAALMMEAESISETSLNFYHITRRNNP